MDHDVRASTVYPEGPDDEHLLMYDRANCDAWILSSALVDFERLHGKDVGADHQRHHDP